MNARMSMYVLSPRVFAFPSGIVSRIVSKRSSSVFPFHLARMARTREIHGLGVRRVKIASVAARTTGLIRVVASLRLRCSKHAAPDRRTGGVLGCRHQSCRQQRRTRERPQLLSFPVSSSETSWGQTWISPAARTLAPAGELFKPKYRHATARLASDGESRLVARKALAD